MCFACVGVQDRVCVSPLCAACEVGLKRINTPFSSQPLHSNLHMPRRTWPGGSWPLTRTDFTDYPYFLSDRCLSNPLLSLHVKRHFFPPFPPSFWPLKPLQALPGFPGFVTNTTVFLNPTNTGGEDESGGVSFKKKETSSWGKHPLI